MVFASPDPPLTEQFASHCRVLNRACPATGLAAPLPGAALNRGHAMKRYYLASINGTMMAIAWAGCSSMIQWPELLIDAPVTCVATKFSSTAMLAP